MTINRNLRVGRITSDKIKDGELLVENAIDALRRYHETQETSSSGEMERLRFDAEVLFSAVNEY